MYYEVRNTVYVAVCGTWLKELFKYSYVSYKLIVIADVESRKLRKNDFYSNHIAVNTVFTRMQDEVSSLNLALKYVRSSKFTYEWPNRIALNRIMQN